MTEARNPLHRVAILDLNNGVPNLGLRSIVELVEKTGASSAAANVSVEVFDVRGKGELPGLNFDVFISSGGPGSPYDDVGESWETAYFQWLDQVRSKNVPTLLICHSFELMVRHFELATVSARRSPSFGIFPVHPTDEADGDAVFGQLHDPFYAADFRDWQVVDADPNRFSELNAKILAREKIRDHVPLERAIMAIRVGSNMFGVQFHPEASPEGMARHFLEDEKMEQVVTTHGEETLVKMQALLKKPDGLSHTYSTVMPKFLDFAFLQG
jgi:homoserine O-succinyltransferase